MRYAFLYLLVVNICNITYCKNPYEGIDVNVLTKLPLPKAKFHIYDPPYEAKAVYKNLKDVDLTTPENLLKSIRSAKTQEWVDFNNKKGFSYEVSDSAFEKRKRIDTEKNFFLINHKLSFVYEGVETVILTYHFVDEGDVGEKTTLTCQKIEDEWKTVSYSALEPLINILMFDSHVLSILFNLSPKESIQDDLVHDILLKVNGSNAYFDVVTFNLIIDEFRKNEDWDKIMRLFNPKK